MTYLNLQSDGNNVFSVEDRMHAFHRKLFLYQGGIKSGNLSVFPSVMDFRDKKYRNDHLLELKPTLGSTWTIYHSNSCYTTHSSERTLGGGNQWTFSPVSKDAASKTKLTEDFQDNLIDV